MVDRPLTQNPGTEPPGTERPHGVLLRPAAMRQPADGLGPRAQRTITGILDAAREVFMVSGFNGATIDEIARVADVSRASVYTYFPSKRDVMLAVGARSAAETDDIIDRLLELGTSEPGVVQWVAEYFAHLDVHGSFAFAWTQVAREDEEIRRTGMIGHLRLCTRLGQAVGTVGGRHVVDPAALGLSLSSILERSWSYAGLYADRMEVARLHAAVGVIVWATVSTPAPDGTLLR